jgi:hypothetical protein
MKKDDLQAIVQIRLLSQKMPQIVRILWQKWKGLDKIKVNLPIFSVKVHVVLPLPQGCLGPSLTKNKLLFSVER